MNQDAATTVTDTPASQFTRRSYTLTPESAAEAGQSLADAARCLIGICQEDLVSVTVTFEEALR